MNFLSLHKEVLDILALPQFAICTEIYIEEKAIDRPLSQSKSLGTVLVRVSIAGKRHHEHGNSYKGNI